MNILDVHSLFIHVLSETTFNYAPRKLAQSSSGLSRGQAHVSRLVAGLSTRAHRKGKQFSLTSYHSHKRQRDPSFHAPIDPSVL